MTTPEQDKIIEALAAEHGAVKVLPLRGADAVLACGWTAQQPIPLTPCCAWVRDSDDRLIATYGLEASRG